MGFGGDAWDVAWAAVYLASDESRYAHRVQTCCRWRYHAEIRLTIARAYGTEGRKCSAVSVLVAEMRPRAMFGNELAGN